ncbi:hypothetical protein BLS_002991 [Venturia inaequalis]|uniref:Kelch repeat protein n=1 Tax=Venturia inaequalis TaxID=5025 RepID=A0A8H3ZCE8_VENIN|nr:hypothetical protein BLS_002991 [Venturia inaequalis]KAE9994435.1 hypothetical protein EG327_010061 [Venturia inaequalis]
MQSLARDGTPRPRRTSAFRETALFRDESQHSARPALKVRFRSKNDIFDSPVPDGHDLEWEDIQEDDTEDLPNTTITQMAPPSPTRALVHRTALLAFVLAVVLTVAQITPFTKHGRPPFGAFGSPFTAPIQELSLSKRADDPTDYCKRWSQQSAIVNGTLYLYGGRKTTAQGQKSNTWNNDFLKFDLTKTWPISTPASSGLAQPSGPPPVANGYLWNSYSSLYMYGGEFSDNPVGTPTANSLWEYDIGSLSWREHTNQQTSAGNNSEAGGIPIERAAEGSGFGLASLGRGWYFGGHLDYLTTQSWTNQIPRVYLKSFVEYTFPGHTNKELKTQNVGSGGAWRNITNAGIQDSNGFTKRADGLLLHVPGYGDEGILLSLGGGTNETFTQMDEVDIFDIAGSTWYRQSTSGPTPEVRVNPCAVVAAAADYQVHMFGGQNLIPWDNQTQYDDMWILTIPAFTWIKVDQSGQSVPHARVGHTCNIWDAQMVSVGGYIGKDIDCEFPGVYVFNTSALQWVSQFTSLSGGSKNPLSQQLSQKDISGKAEGLEGSYGYLVPDAVQKVIGGGPLGGATVTAPVLTATAGPMATGKPITYTVSGPGAVVTVTAPGGGSDSSRGSNLGAIIGGVLAGVFALLALYLGFCLFVYRRRLQMFKRHTAMMEETEKDRASFDAALFSGGAPSSSNASWKKHNSHQSVGNSSSLIGPYHHRASNSVDTSGGQTDSGTNDDTDSESLLEGMEPSFVGVVLNPRRNLRVINRD